MTQKKPKHADQVTLTVPQGAETQVTVGEPILPHGIAWTVRCKIEDAAAVSVWLVQLARDMEGSWRLGRDQQPRADAAGPAAVAWVEDEYYEGRRRLGFK